jgi:hypothetical protein
VARTVTLSNLRTWARRLADVESDPNITDAELTDLANRHITELYDQLVDAGPPDYYAASTTVTTVAGTVTYSLPADFRSLVDVYAQESSTNLRALFPLGAGERGRVRAPSGAWTFTVEYIPTPTLLVNANDTFDGVSGWEELVANLMARDVMVKRQDDPSIVLNSIAQLQGRINTRAKTRDRGHPRFTVDMDEQRGSGWPYGGSTIFVDRYRLRGANLELFEPAGWQGVI